MTSIIKNSNRVRAAVAFVNDVDDTGNNDVYMGLSGTTAWGDENNPDTPRDTIDEASSFWGELFGIAKIAVADTMLVVPKRLWASSANYGTFDNGSADAYIQPFYILASNNYVYECTIAPGNAQANSVTVADAGTGYAVAETITVTGGTFATAAVITVSAVDGSGSITAASITTAGDYSVLPSNPVVGTASISGIDATFDIGFVSTTVTTTEPTTTSGAQTTADGYEWTVLYDLTSFTNLLTTNWMPVENVYATQLKLGATRALIRRQIPDSATTGGKIANTTYRKVAVLFNPVDSGSSQVSVTYGDNTDFDVDFADQPVGVVMMLDHRPPIIRQAAQTETVFAILEF